MMTLVYKKIMKSVILVSLSINFLFPIDLTAPSIPELKAIAWDGYIILTWDKVAEESIDAKTGYADFEGYRLYKSTDGGLTWGQAIPLNGQLAGYQPLFQTDLTEAQDTTRCVYSNNYSNCTEERDVIISGPDPVAPHFNLGNNSFLEHSYVDYDVINGVEYTYAVTAYDMGLRIGNAEYINCTYTDPEDGQPYNQFECEALLNQNTEDPYCVYDTSAENICDWITPPENGSESIIDTSWKRTGNPAKYTCPDGWMCPSFESPKASESFTDYNANGLRDVIEDFIDANNNNLYDEAEEFTDTNNNNMWDIGICQSTNFDNETECESNGFIWLNQEDYIDSNENGQYDTAESFTDLNGNDIWDSINEPFIDCGYIKCVIVEGEYICEFDDQWGEAWIDEVEQQYWVCDGDLLWNELAGNGIWDTNRDFTKNMVTIVPSVNAIDVTFPSGETLNDFFVPDASNIGTGGPGEEVFLKLVDESDLEPYVVKMEIQAEGDEDDFEGFKSRNPFLYVWRVDSISSQNLIPGFYATYTASNLSEEEINNYLDMPGATYSDDNLSIFVPTYEIDPHPIMFSDELGAESNFTQWFSGIQLRFDNYWFELPQTNSFAGISDIKFMNNNGTDDESDDIDIINDNLDSDGNIFLDAYNTDDNALLLPWMMGYFDAPGQWWNNSGGDISLSYWGGSFDSRPMFDYKIEFSTTARPDTAYRVFPSSSEDFCIDVSLTNENWDGNKDEVSLLPLKVTNLATGRQVRSWHNDKGIYTAEGAPSSDDPGYGDCTWNPNETLSFTHDSLAFSDDLDDIDDEKSFELVVNYTLQAMRIKYGADYFTGFEEWSNNIDTEYSITTIVEYAETLWEATEQINQFTIYPDGCDGACPPSLIYDIDGDNLNDNPWKQLYPWEEGDYIIISPDKWYQDGDSWVADLSLLGLEDPSLLTQESLDSIYVNPNPYIVSSVFNEDIYGNRLIFNKLPKQCKISIYTMTGELVDIINHGDENNLDGVHEWDLKNQNGDIVAPGLYIFVVEVDSNLDPRVGKFVIIK